MYQILSLYNLHHDLVWHTKEKYMIYKIVYNGDLNPNGHPCDAIVLRNLYCHFARKRKAF